MTQKDPAKFLSGSPLAAKKHHLFYDGDVRSACKRWLYTGKTYAIDERHPFGADKEDCAACARVLNATKVKAGAP